MQGSFRVRSMLVAQRWWLVVADAMQATGMPPASDDGPKQVRGMHIALQAINEHTPLDLEALSSKEDVELANELTTMLHHIDQNGNWRSDYRPTWVVKETDDG